MGSRRIRTRTGGSSSSIMRKRCGKRRKRMTLTTGRSMWTRWKWKASLKKQPRSRKHRARTTTSRSGHLLKSKARRLECKRGLIRHWLRNRARSRRMRSHITSSRLTRTYTRYSRRYSTMRRRGKARRNRNTGRTEGPTILMRLSMWSR